MLRLIEPAIGPIDSLERYQAPPSETVTVIGCFNTSSDGNSIAFIWMHRRTSMGMFGPVRRFNRVNFPIDPDGSIQGVVGGVLVQVSGSASWADKIACQEKMDFPALAAL